MRRRLWSLWDVYKHWEAVFLTAMIHLQIPITRLSAGTLSEDEFRAETSANLVFLEDIAEQSGLQSIANQTKYVKDHWIRPDIGADILVSQLATLTGTIQKEMTDHLFLRVPHGVRDLYEKDALSSDAIKAFPSAHEELRSASRCFALDEWTASVLHAMRALEFGLSALCKALSVNPSNPNWQNVIEECEKAIKAIGPSFSPTWKADLDFFSAAATDFRFFKSWRNHAMHGHETYDQRRAEEALSHVKSFFDYISVHLSE